MKGVREQLEQELRHAVGRLRRLEGAHALEQAVGPLGHNVSFADEVDEIQVNESREIGYATRELLVERVNRLRAALQRLESGGYGICVECEERIAPARLRAMPEVETCVRCQDRIERFGRRLEPGEAEPVLTEEE